MSDPRPRTGRFSFGCLVAIAIVLVIAIAAIVAIGFALDQGDSATQPSTSLDAGPAENYQPASVTYLEQDHVYVVRRQDGDFYALYDLSSRQQELHGNCRVRYDEQASIAHLEPLPGISGAFVEDCEVGHTAWRVDGEYAFGGGYGNLDRFDTHVDANGHLIIDTGSRTCTRSRGVPGQPPYDERRCGAPD